MGEGAFGVEEGGDEALEHGESEAVYGGDGSARRIAGILTGAAKRARNVLQGANDAELLSICARVGDTAPRPTPPWREGPRIPAQAPLLQPRARADQSFECMSEVSPRSEAPPQAPGGWKKSARHWDEWSQDDDEEPPPAGRAQTAVDVPMRDLEPAPSFISEAVPANSKGAMRLPDGQVLHVDSSGHVINEQGQRCDMQGRPTRARGVAGSGIKKKQERERWGRERWESSQSDWKQGDYDWQGDAAGNNKQDWSDWKGINWNKDDWEDWDQGVWHEKEEPPQAPCSGSQSSGHQWLPEQPRPRPSQSPAAAAPASDGPRPPIFAPPGAGPTQPSFLPPGKADGSQRPITPPRHSGIRTEDTIWASRGWSKEEWKDFLLKTGYTKEGYGPNPPKR